MKTRSGSLIGSAILIVIGIVFLLGNIFPELRPWRLIARFWSDGWRLFATFWPVIIILWGVSKLGSYLRSAQNPVIGKRSFLSGGDIVLLVFLLIFGTTATNLTNIWHGSPPWRKGDFPFEGDFDIFDSGRRFEFSEETTQPLGSDHGPLEIDNKYGSVDVLVHDSPAIRVKLLEKVRAEDEAKGREIADRLRIVIERKELGYALSTNRDDLPKEWRRGLQTHFTVWVPKATALRISNRYGALSVNRVSGNHQVANANGPVAIQNVEGSLKVENRYGAIRLSEITGDCVVENKYGAVEIESVGGRTEIENAYGSVDLKRLKGPVSLANRYGQVVCIDLESTLSVNGKYVDVRGQNIGGDVEVSTSYKDVVLENVLGSISVKGKHGDIDIKTLRPPVKPIVVEAEYSGVQITLPKESQFELDASSKYGKLVSRFDSLDLQQSTAGRSLRVKGSTGRGGPTITIITSYRDIALNPS
jgi:hypothetical protein